MNRGSLTALGCGAYQPASLPAELLFNNDCEVTEQQTGHDVD